MKLKRNCYYCGKERIVTSIQKNKYQTTFNCCKIYQTHHFDNDKFIGGYFLYVIDTSIKNHLQYSIRINIIDKTTELYKNGEKMCFVKTIVDVKNKSPQKHINYLLTLASLC